MVTPMITIAIIEGILGGGIFLTIVSCIIRERKRIHCEYSNTKRHIPVPIARSYGDNIQFTQCRYCGKTIHCVERKTHDVWKAN